MYHDSSHRSLPCLILDVGEYRSQHAPSLHAEATAKANMYKNRLDMLRQRLLRQPQFAPPVTAAEIGKQFHKASQTFLLLTYHRCYLNFIYLIVTFSISFLSFFLSSYCDLFSSRSSSKQAIGMRGIVISLHLLLFVFDGDLWFWGFWEF